MRRARITGSLLIATILALTAGCGASTSDTSAPEVFEPEIHTAPIPEAEFYAPPPIVPQRPGELIRAAVFESSIAGAIGWRVMFSTIPPGDHLSVETGVVLVPRTAPSEAMPVAVWGHPTTGIVASCAPSRQKVADASIAGARELIEAGTIVAAPDYAGLGVEGIGPHPYLIGESLGRSMLDIVRAVDDLPDVNRSDRFAVYGHSEGGQAALFAGQMAPSHAPELELTAVAAMAPSGELDQIFREDHTTVTGALLGGFLGGSWSKWFGGEDVDLPPDQGFSTDSLFERSSWDLVESIGAACSVGEPSVLPLWGQIQEALDEGAFWRRDPGVDAPWAQKLAENSAGQEAIAVPVLLTVGSADDIVSPAAVAATDARYRANGTQVTMRTFAGGDHISAVPMALPDVLEFLGDPTR